MEPTANEILVTKQIAEYCDAVRVEWGIIDDKPYKPEYAVLERTIVGLTFKFLPLADLEVGKTNTSYLINLWHDELRIRRGQSWCITFIQHVFLRASHIFNMPDILPWDTPGSQRLADLAELNGCLTIDPKRATPGSIIIFRDGKQNLGHGEIITAAGPLRYDSLGGNTNSEFSRDGGDIALHTNRAWTVYGPIGTSSGATKRYTRGIIPLPALYERWNA